MTLMSISVDAVIGITLVYFWRRLWSWRTFRGIPRLGIDPGLLGLKTRAAKHEFLTSGQQLLEKGYAQHKDTPYLIQTCDNERLVIPEKFIEELKNLPDTQLSFKGELLDRFMGKYTGLDAVRGTHVHRDVVRFQLTKSLGELLPQMKYEASLALERNLAGCGSKNFTSVTLSTVIFDIIGQITSRRVIDNPAISRDPIWLRTIMGFTASVASFSMSMRTTSPMLRPIAQYALPSGRKLQSDIAQVKKCLRPVIAGRQQERQQSFGENPNTRKLTDNALEDPPRDFIQWLLEYAEAGSPGAEADAIIGKILFLIIAAMHSSAITAIHAIYDLCAHPDAMLELREEASREIGANGWTSNSLLRLPKMESFLKESGRTNSAGIVSFQRLVLSPITLSNGFTIPAGTHICAASDARSRDASLYDSPLEFQPMRFHHPSSSAGSGLARRASDEANAFSSVGAGDSWFGVGRQACPGRWYASAQIKLVVCLFLIDFDFKFPAGQTARPKNWVKDEKTGPDLKQVVLVRRRDVQ